MSIDAVSRRLYPPFLQQLEENYKKEQISSPKLSLPSPHGLSQVFHKDTISSASKEDAAFLEKLKLTPSISIALAHMTQNMEKITHESLKISEEKASKEFYFWKELSKKNIEKLKECLQKDLSLSSWEAIRSISSYLQATSSLIIGGGMMTSIPNAIGAFFLAGGLTKIAAETLSQTNGWEKIAEKISTDPILQEKLAKILAITFHSVSSLSSVVGQSLSYKIFDPTFWINNAIKITKTSGNIATAIGHVGTAYSENNALKAKAIKTQNEKETMHHRKNSQEEIERLRDLFYLLQETTSTLSLAAKCEAERLQIATRA